MALTITSSPPATGPHGSTMIGIAAPNPNTGFSPQPSTGSVPDGIVTFADGSARPGSLPVFGSTWANPNVAGIYLVPSPGAIFTFIFSRHISGVQAALQSRWLDTFGYGVKQIVQRGDVGYLMSAGPGPFAYITSADTVIVELADWVTGSLTLSVVQ